MLSFLRSQQFPRTTTAHLDTITYEDGRSSQTFYPPAAEYFVTHTLPPSTSPTFFDPPLHYHMNQTEYFLIRSGRGRFHLSGTSSIYEAGEIVTIPKCAYHRFENASETEPLVVDIKLDPHKWEMEVSFFRNTFGYLEDCRVAGVQPSVLQLLRFLHAVDCPLGFPIPGPQVFRNWVDWALMKFFGVVIGEGLFGFKGSYPEYYKPKAK